MSTEFRARRDFTALEQRRNQAARLFAAGKLIMAEISRRLGVSRQSVSRWYKQWKRGGVRRLRGAGRAGRKPRLNARQVERLDWELRKGARAHGFGTDLWTLPRVAILIERLTGVHYHPGHVWKLLGVMDWTLQRPAKQARERNPEAIKLWMSEKWPAVKKRSSPKSVDLLPGRKRGIAAPIHPANLGTQRRNPGPDPRFQLVQSLDLRVARLPLGWPAQPPLLPNARRRLQLRKSDRLSEGSQTTPPWSQSDPDLGWPPFAQEPGYDGLPG
jgi:transposase